MQHHPTITGDLTGIFLMAGNWTSLYLSVHPIATDWLQLLGLLFGVIASIVVIVDHCMKITWKVKQYKKSARETKKEKEASDEPK
jgi:hypothetical protein